MHSVDVEKHYFYSILNSPLLRENGPSYGYYTITITITTITNFDGCPEFIICLMRHPSGGNTYEWWIRIQAETFLS